MLKNNSQDQSPTDIELARNAKIKKSRNDAISYGAISFILTILGFYLKSQSQFYNHQIMQYCSSIAFAIGLLFFMTTTNSIFNFHSLKDFPDRSYLAFDKTSTDTELIRNAKIRKSRNDAISFGTTSFILTILGFYLKSQSQFYNHQIMQYCSLVAFAIGLPFFIATTNSIFNFHSLKDFPDQSYFVLDKTKTSNLVNNLDIKKFQEFSVKKANRDSQIITISSNSTSPSKAPSNINFSKLSSKNDNQKYL